MSFLPILRKFQSQSGVDSGRLDALIHNLAASRDEPRTHVVDPYLIHCHAGTVYLVARMKNRDTLTTFALDRLEKVRPLTDETFVRRTDFDAQMFVAESFGGFKRLNLSEE